MRKFLTVACAASLALGGCATRSGLTAGYSDNPRAWLAIVQHPDINGGKIPVAAYREILRIAASCNIQIEAQAIGAAESFVTTGSTYGIAGLAGGTAGSAVAYSDAVVKPIKYGYLNGIAMAFSGGVNGLATGAFSNASAKGQCVERFWSSISQKKQANWEGTFVVTLTGGGKVNAELNLDGAR